MLAAIALICNFKVWANFFADKKKENSAEKRSLSEIIGQKNINKKNNINKKMEEEKMEIERIAQNLSGPRSEELNQERKI